MNLEGERWRKILGQVFLALLLVGGGWQGLIFWRWLRSDRIEVSDLKYRWTVDYAAYRVLHQGDYGFNEQDFAALTQSIGDLTIDLSSETAQVIRDKSTWTGGWMAHQEPEKTDAVVIAWQAPGCPLGKKTVFVRQEGRIAGVLLGGPVPLKQYVLP